MPEVLSNNPFIIAIIVLVLILLIAIPVLIRRRRASADDVLPPPELGQSIDYTSLPYEEPTGLADRFRRLPIGAKLLIFLIPLVLIVAAVIAVLTLQTQTTADNPTPVLPPPTITDVAANVANPTKIRVIASTTLPNGTQVTAVLKENGQDFAWFDPQTAAQVDDGRIELNLEKSPSAPTPKEGQEYTIILSAKANDQTVSSEPAALDVPGPLRAAFYQLVSAAPTTAPTTAPTAAPTTPPQPTTPPPTTLPEPTATETVTLKATVFHGGNIRPRPRIENTPNLPQVHANEVVTLLEKTADGAWYRVDAPEGTGWVSSTLLRIDGDVAKQVPVAGQTPPTPGTTPSGLTATVSHGGHVRETPVTGRPVDEVNAGETVTLLAKTADGAWYRLTDVRGKTGWVHVSLLQIDPAVAKQVPVAR
jgi:hypothetical protein